jgi:anthranilate phosphoribosyltransferase
MGGEDLVDEFKALIGKVAAGASLTREESAAAVRRIMASEATPSQMGALLMALRVRGETVEEITGAALAMRAKMRTVVAPADAVDVVGTGGDGSGSYNISTCAAFVVAGAGIPVAKHGNRALSSRCGAADVLTALGARVDLTPEAVARCIAHAGIGFMFAPLFHPALKHVGPVRAELGTRTLFNLLGPLVNPAGVRRHMVGVFSGQWVEPIAQVLGELGSDRAFVVHGSDGLDEITTSGPTTIAFLDHASVRIFEVTPEEVGLPRVAPGSLTGGDAPANAAAMRRVLQGHKSPYRDVVLLNAAAALVVGERAEDLRDGIQIAAKVVDSGAADAKLSQLVAVSNE